MKQEKREYSFEVHEARMMDFELKKKKLVTAFSVVLSMISMLMLSTLGYKFLLQPSPEQFGGVITTLGAGGPIVSVEYEKIKRDVSAMQGDIDKLKAGYISSPGLISNEVSAKIASLETRMGVIEKAILDSPEKALSIPLMKKEQEALTKRILDFNTASRIEMERQYDLIKWAAGGAFTALFTGLFAFIPFVYRRISGANSRESVPGGI